MFRYYFTKWRKKIGVVINIFFQEASEKCIELISAHSVAGIGAIDGRNEPSTEKSEVPALLLLMKCTVVCTVLVIVFFFFSSTVRQVHASTVHTDTVHLTRIPLR